MRRCLMPAAARAGVHERLRKLLISIRPPSGAENTIPRRLGSASSAVTTRARSGTARREPAVLPYSFSRRERAARTDLPEADRSMGGALARRRGPPPAADRLPHEGRGARGARGGAAPRAARPAASPERDAARVDRRLRRAVRRGAVDGGVAARQHAPGARAVRRRADRWPDGPAGRNLAGVGA